MNEPFATGRWRASDAFVDYRTERLTNVLVERATVADAASSRRPHPVLEEQGVNIPGTVWIRFWLRSEGQIVEKYCRASGAVIGYYAPVCLPIEETDGGLAALPLGLALWIDGDGRVTVLGESAFDDAVDRGTIAPVALEVAEQRIRELTTLTAQRRFPPALVRNFALLPKDVS